SLLGIALGVATLIIVMSVMNGFRAELLGRVLGLNGHMTIAAPAGPLFDFDARAEVARAVPGVIDVTPTVEGQVMVTANDTASGALVRGVRPQDLAEHEIIADNIKSGRLERFGEDSVIIGTRLARRLGVYPGDTITLLA